MQFIPSPIYLPICFLLIYILRNQGIRLKWNCLSLNTDTDSRMSSLRSERYHSTVIFLGWTSCKVWSYVLFVFCWFLSIFYTWRLKLNHGLWGLLSSLVVTTHWKNRASALTQTSCDERENQFHDFNLRRVFMLTFSKHLCCCTCLYIQNCPIEVQPCLFPDTFLSSGKSGRVDVGLKKKIKL